MRGIVLRESLVRPGLIGAMPVTVTRRYPYRLDGRVPVQVIEFCTSADRAGEVALQLADALVPRLFYAHLVGAERMYVAFPGCVAVVHRADPATAMRAQHIGAYVGVPLRQMRFIEMFTVDHPDQEPTTDSSSPGKPVGRSPAAGG